MSKAKAYVLSSEVRSILCRKNDKWSPTTAYERVKQDLNILTKICGVFLGFLRNDNDDELAECSKQSISMISTMMKKALSDDDLLSG